MNNAREDSERRPAGYAGTVVVNIAALWFVNAIPGWEWPFITADFPAVLWALNLSIAFQIAGNALLLFFHPRPVHYLIQAALDVVSLLALVVLVTVFPFAFADPGNLVTRILLFVAIFGTVVGAVVHVLKTVGAIFGRSE